MTWIKICGTTSVGDALISIETGADALGFIFYELSARSVVAETVRNIIASLPDHIEKVGVFVRPTPDQVRVTADASGITTAQIYMDSQSPKLAEFVAVAPHLQWIPSLTMNARKTFDFTNHNPSQVRAFLLDSGSAKTPGGTGKTFDWTASAREVGKIKRLGKVIVAGGLHSGNVGGAIRILEPWGVDVVSGVEASPGKKDPAKVREFVAAVRAVKSAPHQKHARPIKD